MTTQRLSLSAGKRTVLGRKTTRLRLQGMIPAHVFGNNVEGVNISVASKPFLDLYQKAGETSLIDLQVEGEDKPRPVLVTSMDRHPITGQILHIDFFQVNLKEKVSANIPVEVEGESEAVKAGGVLVTVYSEIEVEALPTDLPEKFVVDATKLVAIGDDFKVSDLVYDKSKVTLSLAEDEVLATVKAQEEEAVEETPAEPVEVELTKQGATKEEESSDEVAKTA